MEISVKCICGSVFSFDETPVNGRLAMPVSCTNCGADGTAKANDFIARKIAEASGVVQKPKPAKGIFGFGLGRKKDADDTLQPEPETKSRPDTGDETSLIRLILAGAGALSVGVAGAIGWFYLTRATGFEFGYVAWALGGLVGGASRLFAPRGHYWLGTIGGVAALLAIGGGQYLVGKWIIDGDVRKSVPAAYVDAKDWAQRATAPHSDREFRSAIAEYRLATKVVDEKPGGPIATYQTYQLADLGLTFAGVVKCEDKHVVTYAQREAALDEDKLTEAEIARFKEKTLPALQAFTSGKPSKQDYEETFHNMISSRISFQSLLVQSIGPYSLLWLFLGITTAYRLARNPGLDSYY